MSFLALDNEVKDPRLRSKFVIGKCIETETGKSVARGLSGVREQVAEETLAMTRMTSSSSWA